MDKIVSPEIVTKIPAVVREVIEAIETDMTFRQLLELAGALKAAQQNGLTTEMVPGYPLYIDGVSYWMPDVEELRFAVATGLGVDVDSNIKQRAAKTANEYSESIPQEAGKIPEGGDKIGRPIRNSEDYSSVRRYYDRQGNEISYDPTDALNEYNSNSENSGNRNYDSRNYDSPSENSQRYDSQPQNSNNTVDEPFEDVPIRGNSDRRQ